MIKLVSFLGNYGREYEKTRHNVAWQFEESLFFKDKLSWQKKFKGNFCAVSLEELAKWCSDEGVLSKKDGSPVRIPEDAPRQIYFLKPETYMNNSGQSIISLANYYKIKPEETLIIHDELELPAGTLSLKWSGGLGGHNGLRSTKAVFGTADFWRLRFGIGRPSEGIDIADYVLSPFTQENKILLDKAFDKSAVLFAKLLLYPDPAKLLPEWKKVSV